MGTSPEKEKENWGLSKRGAWEGQKVEKSLMRYEFLPGQRRTILGVDAQYEGKKTAFPPSFILQKGEFIILRRVLLCSDKGLTGVEAHARPQETALLEVLLCGGEWGGVIEGGGNVGGGSR